MAVVTILQGEADKYKGEQALCPNTSAVRNGRHTGIFHTWEECRKEVIGYSGAEYKKLYEPLTMQNNI